MPTQRRRRADTTNTSSTTSVSTTSVTTTAGSPITTEYLRYDLPGTYSVPITYAYNMERWVFDHSSSYAARKAHTQEIPERFRRSKASWERYLEAERKLGLTLDDPKNFASLGFTWEFVYEKISLGEYDSASSALRVVFLRCLSSGALTELNRLLCTLDVSRLNARIAWEIVDQLSPWEGTLGVYPLIRSHVKMKFKRLPSWVSR